MIEYRAFKNSDPPKLVKLWHACRLGRGAASGFAYDAMDLLNFAQPYFDPQGLILACEAGEPVGFVHAGFAANADESGLDKERGVICAVMVRPEFRRQGIGRTLLKHAEDFLKSAGAKQIFAGPAAPMDPFYFGLYGGCQPAGFLESDADAATFMQATGYQPLERRFAFQCDVEDQRIPMSYRLSGVRRKMELAIVDDRNVTHSWWWVTRFGRLDTLQFCLVPKGGGQPVAEATVMGLDLYLNTWNARAVGISDLAVHEPERRKGYAQALLFEIVKRLRQEMVTLIEVQTPATNEAAVALFKSVGFDQVDVGVVYQLDPASGQ